MLKDAGFLFLMRFLSALGLCLLSNQASAQYSVMNKTGNFLHISTRDGLSHNNVTSVYQDSRDFVWASTSDGLNRLNGNNVSSFFHDPANKNSLSANNCWMMSENQAGDLLLATEAGLDVCRFSEDRFGKFFPGGNAVHCIFRDSRGHLWTGTGGQLVELDGRGKLIRNWTDRLNGSGIVQTIGEDLSGNIWVLRDYQLSVLLPAKGSSENQRNNPQNFPWLQYRVRSFAFEKESGAKWILSEAGELHKYNSRDELVRSLKPNPEWQLSRLFVKAGRQLWIGSLGKGLFYFDEQANRFTHYSHDGGKPESISGNVINAMMEDRAGNLWIATTEGLNILPAGAPDVQIYRDWGREKYLPEMPLELTAFFISGDELLTASWGKGMIIRDIKTGNMRQISGGKSDLENMIWDLLPDEDGFWFGSFGGLYRYSNTSGKVVSCKKWPDYPIQRDSVAAIRLFRDSKKQIWVSFSGSNGMMCLNPSAKKLQYFNRKLNPDFDLPHFDAAAESDEGKIFFGHQNRRGLLFYQPEAGRFTPFLGYDDFVKCLLADGKFLWVGSKNGLYLIRQQGQIVRHFSRSDGLPNNQVNSLVKDASGRIWAGTDQGIFCIEQDFSVKTLMSPELEREASIRRAYYESGTRKVWFLSDHALFSFFPDSLKQSGLKLRPVVTRMEAGGILTTMNRRSGPIEIRGEKSPVSFEFDAPCFFQAGKVRYSHKLRGLDTGWSAGSTGTNVSFSHLTAGNYVFCLRATLDGKTWFYASEEIPLVVITPFYRQTWFLILLTCTGFLAVYLAELIYYRIQLSKIRFGQDIRNKISEDIHDDISLGITRIIWQTENLLTKIEIQPAGTRDVLKSILNSARETAARLSEIVWAVNPGHDNLDAFLTYLRHHASSVLDELGITCEIDFPEPLPDQKMNALLVRNLFLIAKEAVNNAIKHSGADKISLAFSLQPDGKYRLSISDNGKGFDSEKFALTGNGLTNMKSRTEKINASLAIQSDSGKGCVILISGPFF